MTGWTLHAGDCLDLVTGLASLADRSVGCTIFDPPFEAEAHSKGRRIARTAIVGEEAKARPGVNRGALVMATKQISYRPITEEQRKGIAYQVARVTRRWILVFCQSEAAHLWRSAFEGAGVRYVRTGVYHKTDAQPQYSGDRPGVGWEAIVICHGTLPRRTRRGGKSRRHTGRTKWNGGGKCARWLSSGDSGGKGLLLDGQKPIELMLQLVDDFTDPGELVLDPTAGTATTGLACILRGRRFVGWERTPETHAMAVLRLSGEEVRPTPGQGQLFGATP